MEKGQREHQRELLGELNLRLKLLQVATHPPPPKRKLLAKNTGFENGFETGTAVTDSSDNGVEVQTALTHGDITEMEEDVQSLQLQLTQSVTKDEMDEKVRNLQKEIQELRKEVKESRLDEDTFKDDDEKVRYYTRLTNWKVLLLLFTFVQPHLKQHSNLTPFQQLLLTLMRL